MPGPLTLPNSVLPTLITALNTLVTLDLPVSGALKVRRIARVVDPIWTDVSAVREEIVAACSTPPTEEGQRAILPEKRAE